MTSDDTNSDKQNIGELADDNLACLTNLEELLGDLERGRDIPEWRIREAQEKLKQAQDNSSEIRRRFENQVGPI